MLRNARCVTQAQGRVAVVDIYDRNVLYVSTTARSRVWSVNGPWVWQREDGESDFVHGRSLPVVKCNIREASIPRMVKRQAAGG